MTGALRDRLRLIVVTDPDCTPGWSVMDVVRAALRGGAPAIQLRGKSMAARDLAELARAVSAETRKAGALLFVNDRVDVALAAGADGAHVGESDLPLPAARRIAPPGFLLGMSADTPEAARRAASAGADYVGVGPVYATGSKADAGAPVGAERIAEVAAAVPVPVVGIGGIAAETAGRVVGAGAAGVAVISAIVRAPDPEGATRRLMAVLDAGR